MAAEFTDPLTSMLDGKPENINEHFRIDADGESILVSKVRDRELKVMEGGVLKEPSPARTAMPNFGMATEEKELLEPSDNAMSEEHIFSNYIPKMTNMSTPHSSFTSALNSITNKIQNMSQPNALTPQNQNRPMSRPPPTPSHDNLKSKLTEAVGPLLDGERIIMFLANLRNVQGSESRNGTEIPADGWSCAMTFYRLILFANVAPNNYTCEIWDRKGASIQWQHYSQPAMYHVIQIPLASIDKVEKILDGYNTPEQITRTLLVTGKDCNRWIKFTCNTVQDCNCAAERLVAYSFPGRRNLGYLFAFEARRAEVLSSQQSPVIVNRRSFDPDAEYARLKIFEPRTVMRGGVACQVQSPWIACREMNRNYGLCGSYPAMFVVPSLADDGEVEGQRLLRKTAAFRSEGRLPVLSWGCGVDGASIWRCSQPKVGLQGNRSSLDERYLRIIAELAGRPTTSSKTQVVSMAYIKMLTGGTDIDLNAKRGTMRIFDMRPKSSALANRTTGYGYENISNYPLCPISFFGIGNIHAVRDAYNKISNICLSPIVNDTNWASLIEDTKWTQMIRLILNASWQTAFHVYFHRIPVLLHCSHGWDRTSQVSVLAQLFLDPYYRTLEGFPVLIEKDFLAFGHPFHTRSGHGEGSRDSSENQNSPIFLQFLDCVWQLLNQFENYFEFNARYILLVSQHIYSCRFGTLLCDNEREREIDASTRQRTYCLWKYLEQNIDKFQLRNPSYLPQKILMPPLPVLLRNVALWQDYFLRYGAKATIPCLDTHLLEFASNRREQTLQHLDPTSPSSKFGFEDMMDLHCMKDNLHLQLHRAHEDTKKWKRIAIEREKELRLLRDSVEEERADKQEEFVGNEFFTVI